MKKRTKIIASLGPSSSTGTKLEKMMHAGTDVFRINLSHTKIEDAIETAEIMDHLAGLGKAGLSTHYRRDKMLQTYFDFIVPKVTRIELSFYI